MARLGSKYVAGFLDADGSVGIVFISTTAYPQLRIGFSQKTSQDEVLHLIHEEHGGCLSYMTVNGVSYSHLTYTGNRQCRKFLNRIKDHLVIKRHYADVCYDLSERRVSKEEIPVIREYLKTHRRQKSLPLPKHVTRKWMAGYIDGDGCFHVHVVKSGTARIVLHVAASNYDTEGIEVMQKQFGGRINDMCQGRVKQYQLQLPPSKAQAVFEPVCKHMVVKQDQVRFILRCAEMGHFRDGKSIKSALKHLKAHPHRLSEPRPDIGSLVARVEDMEPRVPDYSARAKKAWKTRRAKRQSELYDEAASS